MDYIKKNLTLFIGILVPVLMIIFVAASIYLPGIFVQPKYNFLYISGNDSYFYSQFQYIVENEQLIKSQNKLPEEQIYYQKEVIKIYYYDVNKNESREINFEEAQKFKIDSNNISPDGFEVVNGTQGGGFFPIFYYSNGDYNNLYLKGHNVSKKLNLILNGARYDNFRFIGWIK